MSIPAALSRSVMSPKSLLIVGAGEFGATTALAALKSGRYFPVTVIDRSSVLPAPDAASCDINKVIRFDYGSPFYAELAREALRKWNEPEWADIYHECASCSLCMLKLT